ncbi:hypothetical protein EJ08DRAFT_734718, partial [Tothia fuscella]
MKRAVYSLLAVLAANGALAADAPEVAGNPQGVQYLAEMPAGGNQGVIASFSVQVPLDGTGVAFTINVNGASFDGGPFLYHIHELPVPENGNCTATKAHLDPYARGEDPPCDAANPASCQTGDLSGKYGKIQSLPGFSANYTDKYLSLTPGTPSFFGDKSVVLHYSNKTRIACANFHEVKHNSTYGGGSGSNGTYSTSLPTSSDAAGGPTSSVGGGASSTTGGSRPPPGASSSVPASSAMKAMEAQGSILGPLLAIFALMVL